jgi:hypothetical protein
MSTLSTWCAKCYFANRNYIICHSARSHSPNYHPPIRYFDACHSVVRVILLSIILRTVIQLSVSLLNVILQSTCHSVECMSFFWASFWWQAFSLLSLFQMLFCCMSFYWALFCLVLSYNVKFKTSKETWIMSAKNCYVISLGPEQWTILIQPKL